MSSPGSVVAALSQNSILQQSACIEGFKPAQQGFPRRLSMPSAALRVWNSPARPSPPKGRGKISPITIFIPSSRQKSRTTRAFGAYTQMNFPETPHVPGLMLKALCPRLTPSLGKSRVSQSQNKADVQRLGVLGLRYPLSLNCALHLLPACQCCAFFSRWVFLAQGSRKEWVRW